MNKNTILLVDDDVTIINLLSDILCNAGFEILKAFNGSDALEEILKNRPDLIILDWNMPEMDGLEMLKELNKHEGIKDIPVIMLTGVMTDSTHLNEAFEYGAFDFIRKNFDTIELLARIRAALKFVEAHEQIIKLKNNELVLNAMNITQYNNFVLNCMMQLDDLYSLTTEGTEMQKKASEIKAYVQSISTINNWNKFKEHYSALHPHFYKKLSATHPQLGPSELKLCALLKLNLSSKEIARITNTTRDSIKTARTRIRKKMGLETSENIVSYLMQF